MSIGSNSKVVVPGTTDRGIGVTDGDDGRGIVANYSIRGTDPDPWSRIDPDDDGCIFAGAGS